MLWAGPGPMEIGTMAWASPSISRSTSPRAAAGQELYVRYVPGAPGAYRPLSPVVCWAAKRPHENRGDAVNQSRSKHAATVGMMYKKTRRHARMHIHICACAARSPASAPQPRGTAASPEAGCPAVRFIRYRPPTPTASRGQIQNPTRNRILIPRVPGLN